MAWYTEVQKVKKKELAELYDFQTQWSHLLVELGLVRF